MRIFRTVMVILAATFYVNNACAAGSTSIIDEVRDSRPVQRFLPASGGDLQEVRDIGDLYELVIGHANSKMPGRTPDQTSEKHIVYLTKDLSYLVFGNLVDSDWNNLTRERISELNRVDFTKLPLQDAIIIRKGSGGANLVMVTDVDCPYCRKAFEWLDNRTGYTLYVFLFPLDQLHPGSREKSIRILCSKDKAQALKDAKSDRPLHAKSCKDGEALLAKHVLTGQMLGLNGTPLFVLEDGRKVEGFNQPLLEKYLTAGGEKK